MYSDNNSFIATILKRPDMESIGRIKLTTTGYGEIDLTKFIISPGSITRSIEYDTGKTTPGSHNFKISNTKEFGEYLFTLRNDGVPGHTYWPDFTYQVSYGFNDPLGPENSRNDELAQILYEGIVTSKREDRIGMTVDVQSSDILKLLTEKKVANKDLPLSDVYTNIDGTTDADPLQQVIRYGVNTYDDTAFQSYIGRCTIATLAEEGGVTPYPDHKYKICLSTTQSDIVPKTTKDMKVGQAIVITESVTTYNGTYYVWEILSDYEFIVFDLTYITNSGASTFIFEASKSNLSSVPGVGAIYNQGVPEFTISAVNAGSPGGAVRYAVDPDKYYIKAGRTYGTGWPFGAPYYNKLYLTAGSGPASFIYEYAYCEPENVSIEVMYPNDGQTKLDKPGSHDDLPGGCIRGINACGNKQASTDNTGNACEYGQTQGTKFTIIGKYADGYYDGVQKHQDTSFTYLALSANIDAAWGSNQDFWVDGTTILAGQVEGRMDGQDDGRGSSGVLSGSVYSPTVVSYADLGGGWTELRLSITSPYSGYNSGRASFPVTISNSTLGYNGNYVAYQSGLHTPAYMDRFYVKIQTAFLGTEANSRLVGRDMIKRYIGCGQNVNTVSFDSTETGTVYLATGTTMCPSSNLFYFPLQNSFTATDISGILYWDYIAGMWQRFDPKNHTNGDSDQCMYVETVSGVKGVYVRIKIAARIYEPASGITMRQNKFRFGNDIWGTTNTKSRAWQNYVFGRGFWFQTQTPVVSLAIEINHQLTISGTNTYANPIGIMYDIYTSSRLGNFDTSWLDYSNFGALDSSYTWDAITSNFLNAGSFQTGGQIRVSIDKEISVMDLLQKINIQSGVMMIASHIRSTDRRLRLIYNRDYVELTDYPSQLLHYSTLNDIQTLSIDSSTDKTKNYILVSNYIPHTGVVGETDKAEQIKATSGDGTLSLIVNSDNTVIWYDSNTWATTTATNYLAKLEDAWEDVTFSIDARGVIIDPGDYVSLYDHHVNEEIVIQVYSWTMDLSNDSCQITGKKVWSSKD